MKFSIFVAWLAVLAPQLFSQRDSVKVLSHNQDCNEESRIVENDWILVHFTATVDESSVGGKKGEVLQNSNDVGIPIAVQLSENKILPGWIQGLVGIACEGSKIELLVPPELGFGDDLTVLFSLDILKVSKDEIEEPSMFDLLDEDKDGQISLNEFTVYFQTRRPQELTETGEPPLGLFMQEDVNQNKMLNWEEFGGPKGSAPPTVAKAIILKESLDPNLTRFKKGDPLEARIEFKPDDEITHDVQFEEDLTNQVREEFEAMQAHPGFKKMQMEETEEEL